MDHFLCLRYILHYRTTFRLRREEAKQTIVTQFFKKIELKHHVILEILNDFEMAKLAMSFYQWENQVASHVQHLPRKRYKMVNNDTCNGKEPHSNFEAKDGNFFPLALRHIISWLRALCYYSIQKIKICSSLLTSI